MKNQKLYDLLYVTRNTTALRIMDDIACKLKRPSKCKPNLRGWLIGYCVAVFYYTMSYV